MKNPYTTGKVIGVDTLNQFGCIIKHNGKPMAIALDKDQEQAKFKAQVMCEVYHAAETEDNGRIAFAANLRAVSKFL
jgi:hypothetical protein